MSSKSAGIFVLSVAIAITAITTGSRGQSIPEGVEMIIWEHQSWKSHGGFERLTIWKDGRSEVVVVPVRYTSKSQDNLRAKTGWEKIKVESPPHVEFVCKNIYPPDVARAKFDEALIAGIHLLESFKPGYRDGRAIRVVVQIKGQQKEVIIPTFMDSDKGTLNHKRFLAVSEILDGFDKSAYEVEQK